MKVILNLLKILLGILVVFILIQNADQIINLKILTLYYPDIHFSLVALAIMAFGAILGALMMGFAYMQSKSDIRLLQKRNKQLLKELENLRNISVDEIPDDDIDNSEISEG